jgi:hypothetical protein
MAKRAALELLLFLLPFAIFFLYRAASRDLNIRDRWPLTTLVVVGGVLAVGALVLGPLMAPSDAGTCYEAARYENGKTIPAKKVPCDAVTVPDHPAAPPSGAPPVAPRDQDKTPGQ